MAWFLALFKLGKTSALPHEIAQHFQQVTDGSVNQLCRSWWNNLLQKCLKTTFCCIFVQGFSMECERGACARATRSRKNTSCGLEFWGPWPHTSARRCTSFRPRELFISSTNLPSKVFFQELHLLDPHLERKSMNHGEPQLHICYETTIGSDGFVCVYSLWTHWKSCCIPSRRLFSSSRRRFISSHATHPTASQFLEQSRFGFACCTLGSFLGARFMSSRWQEI